MAEMGWWVISGDRLIKLLRRAHAGESPDLLYAEEYANSETERVPAEAAQADKLALANEIIDCLKAMLRDMHRAVSRWEP